MARTYTVVTGDTLSDIAIRYGTTVAVLLALNPAFVDDPNLIHPGDVIVIPVGSSVFDVTDYGAVGDGVTDDTVAIQSTIDAAEVNGGTVYCPIALAYYKVTSVYLKNNFVKAVTLLGEGYGSRLISSTDSVIKMGDVSGLTMRNMAFITSAADKGAIELVGSFSRSLIERCHFETWNKEANAVRAYGSNWGMYDVMWLNCTYSADGNGSSVPIVYLVDTAGGGICNANTFLNGRLISSVAATGPVWFMESRGHNYLYGNTIQGINFEIPNGGAIHANGTKFLAIRDCGFYDVGIATGDMIRFGKHPTGLRGEGNIVENTHRISGTIGDFWDINIVNTFHTTVIGSGAHPKSTGKIDAHNMLGTVVINPYADTVVNVPV